MSLNGDLVSACQAENVDLSEIRRLIAEGATVTSVESPMNNFNCIHELCANPERFSDALEAKNRIDAIKSLLKTDTCKRGREPHQLIKKASRFLLTPSGKVKPKLVTQNTHQTKPKRKITGSFSLIKTKASPKPDLQKLVCHANAKRNSPMLPLRKGSTLSSSSRMSSSSMASGNLSSGAMHSPLINHSEKLIDSCQVGSIGRFDTSSHESLVEEVVHQPLLASILKVLLRTEPKDEDTRKLFKSFYKGCLDQCPDLSARSLITKGVFYSPEDIAKGKNEWVPTWHLALDNHLEDRSRLRKPISKAESMRHASGSPSKLTHNSRHSEAASSLDDFGRSAGKSINVSLLKMMLGSQANLKIESYRYIFRKKQFCAAKTALYYLCEKSIEQPELLDLVVLLVLHGADVNQPSLFKDFDFKKKNHWVMESPLQLAIRTGNLSLLRVILKDGNLDLPQVSCGLDKLPKFTYSGPDFERFGLTVFSNSFGASPASGEDHRYSISNIYKHMVKQGRKPKNRGKIWLSERFSLVLKIKNKDREEEVLDVCNQMTPPRNFKGSFKSLIHLPE